MDRLALRRRPHGTPLLRQTWGHLLFLHWPVPADVLRPLLPARLQLDTWEGQAWLGVTPFTMWDVRPSGLPPLPLLSRSHELNVRTYVHLDGVPGVWFFSLDANNPLAVVGARLGFGLPYFQARMALRRTGDQVHFTSRRWHPGAPPAHLEVRWTAGAPRPEALPETLDFFLIERYCLYTRRGADLWRARIFHRPWPLRHASVSHLDAALFGDLNAPASPPLVHAQAAPLDVGIWRPERV